MSTDPDFDRIYRMLEVTPDQGWDAIKHAYRKKAQAYHPDRAIGNPRIEKIATNRFEDLTKSFDQLKRYYRIFGQPPPQSRKSKTDPIPSPNEQLTTAKKGANQATEEILRKTGRPNAVSSRDNEASNRLLTWVMRFSVVTLLVAVIILLLATG